MLTKRESVLRKGAWAESRRVRAARENCSPAGSQSWASWWCDSFWVVFGQSL